eukprot:TRINITY_DN7196_c1_g1_i1.p1 TRINITY_DN7196_c1_g1~~TRINITY_DN7196_c1_g1_i1.p1  ORF type:complete len:321 (+),score=40.18 TRINITY_DN7196_c1_g1_i1:608-1570(+)
MHDCREDSAALFHQHGVKLTAVFDTQAAHAVLERHQGRPAFAISGAEILRHRLGIQDPPETAELKSLMLQDPQLWARRPLTGSLVRYALHGVAPLLDLRDSLVQEATEISSNAKSIREPGLSRRRRKNPVISSSTESQDDSSGSIGPEQIFLDMVHTSNRALDYRDLNREFPTAESMAKIGSRLWALAAARNDRALYFKLNAGRVGVVSTPSALSRFKDVQPGDLALCCVSGVSMDGSYLYLDRYDHDWDFFDHQLRPSGEPEVGVYGREHRHSTTSPALPDNGSMDPLLLRGLPAFNDSTALDAWEADSEDVESWRSRQ